VYRWYSLINIKIDFLPSFPPSISSAAIPSHRKFIKEDDSNFLLKKFLIQIKVLEFKVNIFSVFFEFEN